MAKKPTAEDARLILQLYDLRREAEMRKARHWWLITFWPENADAYLKIDLAFGSQENNWLRQLTGYWGMAASMVLQGALNEKLFLEPAFSGEMFFIFAKIHPFLKELREKTQNPDMMGNIERVIMGTKEGRQRFERISQRVAFRRKTMQKPLRDVCRRLVRGSPVSPGGKQLQSDSVGTIFQSLAVHDAGP